MAELETPIPLVDVLVALIREQEETHPGLCEQVRQALEPKPEPEL